MLRHHRHRADLEDAEERAERLLQREHHRMVVRRLDLVDLREVGAGAGVGLLQHLDREQDVRGGEGLAVMPGDALPELERVGLGVLADAPALGELRLRFELRAVAQQALEDVARHHLGRTVLDHRKHQAGRLGLDHRIDHTARFRLLRQCRGRKAASQQKTKQHSFWHIVSFSSVTSRQRFARHGAQSYVRPIPVPIRERGSHSPVRRRKMKVATVFAQKMYSASCYPTCSPPWRIGRSR